MKFQPNSTTGTAAHLPAVQNKTNDVPPIPPDSAQVSLHAVIEEWLLSLQHKKHSPRTIRLYRLALRNFSKYLVLHDVNRVQDVDAACLQGWQTSLATQGLVVASITGYLGVARNWYRWLTDSGRVFLNPAANFRLPAAPRLLGPIVSEADMIRLLDSVNGTDQLSLRDRGILELAYASAARLEEIARLDVDSIDLPRGLVRLRGKGDVERIVPLTRCAVTALRNYLGARSGMLGSNKKERGLFIGLRTGTRLRPDPISHIIRDRAAAIGVKVLPHMIRRSTATHMVVHGAPIAYVKVLLGHRTYRHLGRYVQIQGAQAMNLAREGRKRS